MQTSSRQCGGALVLTSCALVYSFFVCVATPAQSAQFDVYGSSNPEAEVLLRRVVELRGETEKPNGAVTKFFSNNAIRQMLGMLLELNDPVDVADVRRAVVNRLRFAANITVIHGLSVTHRSADERLLTIQYSDWEECPQKSLELKYVLESESWVIEQVGYKLPPSNQLEREVLRFGVSPVRFVPKCRNSK